jgi:hypothetical protein
MGRIDAIIDDNVIAEFKIAIIKRLGGKKGDFSKALEEAMILWSKQDVFKNLVTKGMNNTTTPKELKTIVDTLASHGKIGIYPISEFLKKSDIIPTELEYINKTIQALNKYKTTI